MILFKGTSEEVYISLQHVQYVKLIHPKNEEGMYNGCSRNYVELQIYFDNGKLEFISPLTNFNKVDKNPVKLITGEDWLVDRDNYQVSFATKDDGSYVEDKLNLVQTYDMLIEKLEEYE